MPINYFWRPATDVNWARPLFPRAAHRHRLVVFGRLSDRRAPRRLLAHTPAVVEVVPPVWPRVAGAAERLSAQGIYLHWTDFSLMQRTRGISLFGLGRSALQSYYDLLERFEIIHLVK